MQKLLRSLLAVIQLSRAIKFAPSTHDLAALLPADFNGTLSDCTYKVDQLFALICPSQVLVVDAKSLFMPPSLEANATLEFEFKVQENELDPSQLKQLQINEFAISGTFKNNTMEMMYYDMY